MFDESAYHTGGPFRPERQFPAAPVLKGVHFFFHDIRGFADGALEQAQGFKGGSANFLITKLLEQTTREGFQDLELGRFRGQDVMRAANGLILSGHGRELYDTYVY